MKRINVIGMSGSGKSTTARSMAAILGSEAIEVDSIFWQPYWQEPDPAEFRGKLTEIAAGDTWVVDGNYSSWARDIIWDRADTVVWLDLRFPVVFGRVLLRTLRRIRTGEELWSGNRESARNAFFSKSSLLWWVIRHYRRNRRKNAGDLSRHPHLAVHRFRDPRSLDRWLNQLRSG